MEKLQNPQAQTQTKEQTEAQIIAPKIAQKLLSGELLTPQEAHLLTVDKKVVREVHLLLWHYTAWGW